MLEGRPLPKDYPEIKILGKYTPTELFPDSIEQEFRKLPFLPDCCRRERIGIRVPLPTTPDPPGANLEWHQDGGGIEGTTHHMIVWASEDPTHVKSSDGIEFKYEAGDVVWYNNTLAFHKQPSTTNDKHRWFVSVRCSGELI